jgi:AraC-like DNA-binding protein
MTIQLERDREAFLRNPVGRYANAPGHVVWCANAELLGSIHWGTLDDRAVQHLDDVLRLAASAGLAPSCGVVVDCRDVDSVDVSSLAIGPARAGTGPRVLVVPPGPRGLLISGVLLQRHQRWRVFQDQAQAIASLDREDALAALAEADRAAASARELSPMIVELRRGLADDVTDATVGRCARRLATSVRSLQRELERHGTSYSKELRRARLDAALDLLRHTDLKIEAIAMKSGVGTASRLSKLVRASFGVSARELRERLKSAA